MPEPLQTFTWKITLLTPLHIGSGESLWEGFDFVRDGPETVVLNQDKLWEDRLFGDADPDASLNLTLLRQQPGSVVTAKDLAPGSPSVRYRLRGLPQGAEVRAQLKDAWGRPYLPGSTLKGALRTVLLWDLVRSGRVQLNESRLGDRREYAGQALEQAAFGADPNHDLLRTLKIGDSTPVDVEALQLVRATAFSPGTQQQNIPINVEAVVDGKSVTTPVTVESYLFDQPSLGFGAYRSWLTQELPAVARAWAKEQLRGELDTFRNYRWQTPHQVSRLLRKQVADLPDNAFMLQIGWGTGWLVKTIGSLLPDATREQIIGRYRLSRGRRQPGAPFPKSRRLSNLRPQGQAEPGIPLGWVLVEVMAA